MRLDLPLERLASLADFVLRLRPVDLGRELPVARLSPLVLALQCSCGLLRAEAREVGQLGGAHDVNHVPVLLGRARPRGRARPHPAAHPAPGLLSSVSHDLAPVGCPELPPRLVPQLLWELHQHRP
eukprot:2178802-Alexandrium_andersonii.AAC.1